MVRPKKDTITEPIKKLESLLVVVTCVAGYFYLYVYQNMLHIEVELISLKTLLQMPIIALVILPLIHYIIVRADPLQRSPSQRETIKFFQNEFPSKYISARCKRCIEDESSCPNYIRPESYDHVRYWFQNIFHGAIEKEDPGRVKDTFEKGYVCKLVYYLSWIVFILFLLASVTIIFHHLYLYIAGKFNVELEPLQIIFPIACIGIIILMKMVNKVDDESPSGCWHAWREVNKIHVSWLKSKEDFLVELICHANGGAKRFAQK